MKVVILCGGLGTRLSEITDRKPKPMVEIGGSPILWHILSLYSAQGFKEFVLTLGYKGEVIKDYFLNYRARSSDVEVDLGNGQISYVSNHCQDWTVRMQETGDETMTGGRLARLEEYLRPRGTFMLTYGDGLADVDLGRLLDFHRCHGRIGTVTTVRPPGRFGAIALEGDLVTEFKEKPQAGGGWINGGFFVFEPEFFDYLDGDATVLEGRPLERLAAEGELAAYRHAGAWQCMDTLRDKRLLENEWQSGSAFWKVW